MLSLDSPRSFLATLAPQSAAAWHALGARLFPNELSIQTDNSTYRFKNGVFVSRAQKPARSFDCPKEMRGLRLVGFLHDEGGLWSLSPRWRFGSHAALWRPGPTDAASFILTSATTEFTLEEVSGVMIRRIARPPSIRHPLPPSMTRIHNAPTQP